MQSFNPIKVLITLSAFLSLAVIVVAPYQASAATSRNSVHVDDIVLSRCGDQQVALSGTASYGPGQQTLIVDLDGRSVINSTDEPAIWAVLTPVAVGSHVITARVHDADVSKTVDYALTFSVAACKNSGEGGGGDETDCCPGADPFVEQPKVSVPQIKGATTTHQGSLKGLDPLNSVFRFVFGRTPTFIEWKYWANRYLSDKPAWDELMGAMQWHYLTGATIGR